VATAWEGSGRSLLPFGNVATQTIFSSLLLARKLDYATIKSYERSEQ